MSEEERCHEHLAERVILLLEDIANTNREILHAVRNIERERDSTSPE